MKLMLTRHGQTVSNLEMRLDTRPPGAPLSEEGHRQALELAERLAEEPIAAVYASESTRARQTGEPLADKLGVAVETLPGVTEVLAGDWEDRNDSATIASYLEICQSWAAGGLDAGMPGGETGHEFLGRYRGALETLRERHPEDLVVLVSHGAAIRIAAGYLAANVAAQLPSTALLVNTGQVVLETDGQGWRCVSWPGLQLR